MIGTDLPLGGRSLPRLPTRDAMIVHLGILCRAASEKKKVSELLAELPARFTASDRLQDFPTETSQSRLAELERGGPAAIESAFASFGAVRHVGTLDGLRVTFANGNIVHLRASGNAPELRCYTEAATDQGARALNAEAMRVLESWR